MKSMVMIATLGLVLTAAAPAFAGGRHNGLNIGIGAGLLVSTHNLLTHRTSIGANLGANLGANVSIKGGLLGLLLGGNNSRGHGEHGGCGCW